MKNLLITFIFAGLWGVSYGEDGNSFNPQNYSTQETEMTIESWMLASDWFSTTEKEITLSELEKIDLKIDSEEDLKIENWMKADLSDISTENNIQIENWMLSSTQKFQEKNLQLEEWMF